MKVLLPVMGMAASLLLGSCASIVSHSNWPVTIGSMPVGANISIVNKSGQEVYKGVTPAATSLKSGAGFFEGEQYTVKVSMPGYDTQITPLGTTINGWYFGNLGFGGLIGFLIVDPLTGAMYRLDQRMVQVNLVQSRAQNAPELGPDSPQVVRLDKVPAELRDQLVRIDPQEVPAELRAKLLQVK